MCWDIVIQTAGTDYTSTVHTTLSKLISVTFLHQLSRHSSPFISVGVTISLDVLVDLIPWFCQDILSLWTFLTLTQCTIMRIDQHTHRCCPFESESESSDTRYEFITPSSYRRSLRHSKPYLHAQYKYFFTMSLSHRMRTPCELKIHTYRLLFNSKSRLR